VVKLEKEDKTQFTLKHAELLFRTIAEIGVEKYAPNIKVLAKVKEKMIEEEENK
jgi:hypothetical protein